MTTSNRGFTTVFLAAVEAADAALPAVQLAKLCIKNNVPMAAIAAKLGVTRATMYSWATGQSTPSDENLTKVLKWLERMRQQA